MPTFRISSILRIAPDAFWRGMSMTAVNAELVPLVRMTTPREWRDCPLTQWSTGDVLFRSTLLLFGFLPVDVHALRLERIDTEGGFLERSSSWTNRMWQHERTTVATESGCVLTDTVTVQGRIHFLTVLLMPVYRWVFRHRHRRLRSRHGSLLDHRPDGAR